MDRGCPPRALAGPRPPNRERNAAIRAPLHRATLSRRWHDRKPRVHPRRAVDGGHPPLRCQDGLSDRAGTDCAPKNEWRNDPDGGDTPGRTCGGCFRASGRACDPRRPPPGLGAGRRRLPEPHDPPDRPLHAGRHHRHRRPHPGRAADPAPRPAGGGGEPGRGGRQCRLRGGREGGPGRLHAPDVHHQQRRHQLQPLRRADALQAGGPRRAPG